MNIYTCTTDSDINISLDLVHPNIHVVTFCVFFTFSQKVTKL